MNLFKLSSTYSINHNATLGNSVIIWNRVASEDKIDRACDIAQMTELLQELPNDHETELSNNGVRLSGGQRQRVSMAHPLIKDSKLLVLHEATSDFTIALQERVLQLIESMKQKYAIIVIAHHLSAETSTDQLCTIENREIVEAFSQRNCSIETASTPISTKDRSMVEGGYK